MLRFLRQRRFRPLRLPALALLLLAVLANPVLAALGDLHELRSGGEHVHAVAEHGDNSPGEPHHDEGQGDGSLLHALIHASHCCGHLTAILPAAVLALDVTAPMAAPVAGATPIPRSRPESLLRPPISV